MVAADALWLIWAHLRLRRLKHARWWQLLSAAFVIFQLASLSWIILFRTGHADPPPGFAAAPAYIWHLLILPMVKVGDHWKLSDVLQNTSKTCTG